MATNIFPGVYTTITDNSFYTQPLPGVVAFMCLFSEKGPDNVPRLTTSLEDLIETYGTGNKAYYGEGWYVAKQFVSILGNLYVMRVLPNDAEYANICLKYNTSLSTPAVELSSQNNLTAMSVINAGITSGAYDVCFRPVGRGEYYNKIAIKLTPSTDYTEYNCYELDIYKEIDATGEYGLFESFVVSFNSEAADVQADSLFVVDVLERYSEILRATVKEDIDGSKDWGLPFTTRVNLNHGSDGTMYNATTGYLDWNTATPAMALSYIGATTNPVTGDYNYEITDPECLEFSIVFDAGYPFAVKESIVDLCESRTDCFALLDMRDNPRPATALTTRQTDCNFNTFRAAVYEPYTKVYDPYTGAYMWITPLYHVSECLAKTERDYDLWWPFAGLTRGALNGIKDIRYKLQGNYKNEFKLHQINPIMRFTHGGDAIWGNWVRREAA